MPIVCKFLYTVYTVLNLISRGKALILTERKSHSGELATIECVVSRCPNPNPPSPISMVGEDVFPNRNY